MTALVWLLGTVSALQLARGPSPPRRLNAIADDERLSRALSAQTAKAEREEDEASRLAAIAAEQAVLFRRTLGTLVGDHALISAVIFAFIWRFGPLSMAYSYAVGAAFGAAYLVLLARFVESVGKQTFEGVRSSGVSQARFALVGVLILIIGKNKDVLDFIPVMLGFFSYQLASFAQAFRPPSDEET